MIAGKLRMKPLPKDLKIETLTKANWPTILIHTKYLGIKDD